MKDYWTVKAELQTLHDMQLWIEQPGNEFITKKRKEVTGDALALLEVREPRRPTYHQGKVYCGVCGKRIPTKIGARFCHKCGRPIMWNNENNEEEQA